ncbi:hypothetical protein, partial [Pseudomonas sp. GW531-R1]|uniref:hypothetical protein n=1 Tax=Pseudomonas sp. GW531-R1 TaxID=2075556 RepID=UPI001C4458B5
NKNTDCHSAIGGKPPPTVRLFDVVACSGDRAHEKTLSRGHVKSKGGRGLAPDGGVSEAKMQTDTP